VSRITSKSRSWGAEGAWTDVEEFHGLNMHFSAFKRWLAWPIRSGLALQLDVLSRRCRF